MSFFILGLPRSRTAWLANFLTYDDLFCYHEGIDGCSSMEEYKNKIGDDGDSCTGLVMLDIDRYFPDAKKVIIDTSIDKAVQFGKDAYGVDMTDIMTQAKNKLDNTDGLHIDLNQIDDRLCDIWEYVTDKPFNEKRAKLLKKLNVQVKNVFDIDVESMLNLKESNELCLG